MSPIVRRNARRRLPQSVKDYVAEGGKVLATDDDLLFAVGTKASEGLAPDAQAAPPLKLRSRRAAGMSSSNAVPRSRAGRAFATRSTTETGTHNGGTQ